MLSTTAHRLFSILLCAVGRTTAHTSAGDVTVIVYEWDDFIQNGLPISLFAENNYLAVTPEEKINIGITPDCCARANLVQSSNTTLTFKNDTGGQLFSVHVPLPEGKTSVGWSFI